MSTIENSAVEEVLENDGPSFFMKLIHLWILPSIYAVILGSIILHFTGVSFGSQFKIAKAITNSLVAKEEKSDKKTTTKKASTSTDNKTVDTSEKSNTSKTDQTSSDNGSQANSTGTESNNQSAGSSVTNTLSSMDPRVTAKLLSYMKADNALKILKQLDSKAQSAIIAELPSEDGARMTEALASGDEPATSTTTAAQLYQQMKPDQIAAVLSGIKNNEEVLYQIRQMDPNTASKVISLLKSDLAGWIVTQLKP